MKKDHGLQSKYLVERLDGKFVGKCIVLEFSDPIAQPAIERWAQEMFENGYPLVAQDVREILDQAGYFQ